MGSAAIPMSDTLSNSVLVDVKIRHKHFSYVMASSEKNLAVLGIYSTGIL